MSFVLKFASFVSLLGFFTYSYLDRQNDCTRLKIQIPQMSQEIADVREKNRAIQYQIECFERPGHLLEIASVYPHLKFPFMEEILILNEGIALLPVLKEERLKKKGEMMIGAKQP